MNTSVRLFVIAAAFVTSNLLAGAAVAQSCGRIPDACFGENLPPDLKAACAKCMGKNQSSPNSGAGTSALPQYVWPSSGAQRGQAIGNALQNFGTQLRQYQSLPQGADDGDDDSVRLKQQSLEQERRAQQARQQAYRRRQEDSLRQQRIAEQQRQAQLQAEADAKRRQLEELKAKQKDQQYRASLANPWAGPGEGKQTKNANPFE